MSNGDVKIIAVEADGSLKVVKSIAMVHDFGVNSLDAKKIDKDHILIVSGGDDQ